MGQEELSSDAIRAGLRTQLIGSSVLYLPRTTSTMNVARFEADRGAPVGTLVVADEQTAGRGRFGRSWVSPVGCNLLISVIFRPGLDLLAKLNMAASLAVARATFAATGIGPTIKWPNDVHIKGRKVGGILIESRMQRGRLQYAIVGIGININFDPSSYPEVASGATSLLHELGHPFSRLEFLLNLLTELEQLYLTLGDTDVVRQEWIALLETLGQRVQVWWRGRMEEGLALDVDVDGNLMLQRQDSSVIIVSVGDVTLRGAGETSMDV